MPPRLGKALSGLELFFRGIMLSFFVMKKTSYRPTIRDVANYVGVSPTTVSHALSGKRPVALETRQRIMEAIHLLGYEPSLLARRLAGQPTRIITLVFPLVSGLFSSIEQRYIASIGQPLTDRGYAFMVIYAPMMDMEQFRDFLGSHLADGLILMQIQLEDPRLLLLEDSPVPFVMIGRAADNTGLNYVDQDFEAGLREALVYLHGLGHRRVALFHYYDERLGFVARQKAVFQQEGTALGLQTWCVPTEMSDVSAYQAVRVLLEQPERPTAFIAWNELIATGIVLQAREHGLQMPRDFSLICYDRSPLHAAVSQPLTILDTQIETMGQRAAAILLALLEGSQQLYQELIPARLVIGKSTGPAPQE